MILGISAGSMNAASIVYAQPEMDGESIDPTYERYLPGLGLTDVQILPHYQQIRDWLLDGRRLFEDITYADSIGHCFYALVDGSYLYRDDDGQRLIGEAHCRRHDLSGLQRRSVHFHLTQNRLCFSLQRQFCIIRAASPLWMESRFHFHQARIRPVRADPPAEFRIDWQVHAGRSCLDCG